MIGGLDLGGSTIDARAFDNNGLEIARQCVATPTSHYDELVDALEFQVRWLEGIGPLSAIGLGSPGLIHPVSGLMLTANLPATGRCLGADLSQRVGRDIPVINDARAALYAEVMAGVAQGVNNVVGLVIGTGIGGAQFIEGRPLPDLNGQHAEFGHVPLPAAAAQRHGLPVTACGCGLAGCFETYVSGPGVSQLALTLTGAEVSPEKVFVETGHHRVRAVWLDLMAELVGVIMRTSDPSMVVLSGGLGMLSGLPEELAVGVESKRLPHTVSPRIMQARHGGACGALGAAFHAADVMRAGSQT